MEFDLVHEEPFGFRVVHHEYLLKSYPGLFGRLLKTHTYLTQPYQMK